MFSIVAIFNFQGAQSMPVKDDTDEQKYNERLTVVWKWMQNKFCYCCFAAVWFEWFYLLHWHEWTEAQDKR